MRDYDFGNFLREQRELRGLSQYQLGALVGVSDKAVSKWENGVSRPSSRILGGLCAALGITVDELFSCNLRSVENVKGAFAMKKELWERAYLKLEENFGGSPPAAALDRLESERAELENTDTIIYFGLLGRISERAREAETRFRPLGYPAAFYTAYLLGASDIDPLSPYYHCPVCHATEFAGGVSDCWDLPPKVCSCGAKLFSDGHDIPFETYRYVIGKNERIGGEVASSFFESAQDTVREYFAENGVLKVIRDDRPDNATFLILPPEHPRANEKTILYKEYAEMYRSYMSVTIVSSDELEICRRLEAETVTSMDRIPYYGKEVFDAFVRLDIKGIPQFDGVSGEGDFMRNLLSELKATTFSDLIKAQGLAHGTGVWQDNAQLLLQSGAPSDSIIAYRDDVYMYLLKKTRAQGISGNGIAYQVMRDAYRGIIARNGIDETTQRLFSELEVEDRFSESLKKIHYLFPKAHGVAFVKYALIMMWYKLNFPEVFERVMKDKNG